jgi:hypothetical protein
MPKIDIAAVPVRLGSGYPRPFDAPCAARTAGAWARPAVFVISAST